MSIQSEQETIRAMIALYCRKRHARESLCDACAELLQYSMQRLAKCCFGDGKPQCRYCPVHCYSPEMRKRISEVMRFSGPRLILHHPALAIRHMLNRRKPGRADIPRD